MNSNLTARAISKAVFAFTLMFGFYLMVHGHLSHGAGFAGGVIIALSFLQAMLVLGRNNTSAIINRRNAKGVMVISTAVLLVMSILGYIYGKGFMSNLMLPGSPFALLGAGTAVIFSAVFCLFTAGCLISIFLSIFDEYGKE